MIGIYCLSTDGIVNHVNNKDKRLILQTQDIFIPVIDILFCGLCMI